MKNKKIIYPSKKIVDSDPEHLKDGLIKSFDIELIKKKASKSNVNLNGEIKKEATSFPIDSHNKELFKHKKIVNTPLSSGKTTGPSAITIPNADLSA